MSAFLQMGKNDSLRLVKVDIDHADCALLEHVKTAGADVIPLPLPLLFPFPFSNM